MRRWFDPWPVFFKREFNRNWPFLVGFAITGTIITKFSLGLTGNIFSSRSLQYRKMPRTRPSFRGTRGDQLISKAYVVALLVMMCFSFFGCYEL
ncbi:hypothetical protein SCA6_010163 [Theobroma cacao]